MAVDVRAYLRLGAPSPRGGTPRPRNPRWKVPMLRSAPLALVPLLLLAGCGEVKGLVESVKTAATEAKERASIPPMPCDADVSTAPPENACVSGELTCGSVIEGTTEGGVNFWGDDFYSHKFCFPAGDDRSGPERVYVFHAPANTDVRIRLDSDCAELDLAAVAWAWDGTCPGVNHLVPECESDNAEGGGRVRLNVFKPRDYLVAVEGKGGASGTFRLTVECGSL